jgi:hypothetical protein
MSQFLLASSADGTVASMVLSSKGAIVAEMMRIRRADEVSGDPDKIDLPSATSNAFEFMKRFGAHAIGIALGLICGWISSAGRDGNHMETLRDHIAAFTAALQVMIKEGVVYTGVAVITRVPAASCDRNSRASAPGLADLLSDVSLALPGGLPLWLRALAPPQSPSPSAANIDSIASSDIQIGIESCRAEVLARMDAWIHALSLAKPAVAVPSASAAAEAASKSVSDSTPVVAHAKGKQSAAAPTLSSEDDGWNWSDGDDCNDPLAPPPHAPSSEEATQQSGLHPDVPLTSAAEAAVDTERKSGIVPLEEAAGVDTAKEAMQEKSVIPLVTAGDYSRIRRFVKILRSYCDDVLRGEDAVVLDGQEKKKDSSMRSSSNSRKID